MNSLKQLLWIALFFQSFQICAQMDIQGHMGCRGLMPENTIPAMLHAIDLGVKTLEMGVIITGDREILVSNEHWASAKICVDKDGSPLQRKDERSFHNLYNMSLFDAQKYDCGSLGNPDFPEQQKIKVNKPEFNELIQTCEEYVRSKRGKPVYYYIEIKSTADGETLFHPEVAEYCEIVVAAVKELLPLDRVCIQSFDTRVLKYIHARHPDIKLGYLLESWNVSLFEDEFSALGFTPHTLSPYYRILDKKIVKEAHMMKMKVVPWTINNISDMEGMAEMGVDGIITDYPDRALEIFDAYNVWD